MTDRRSNAEDAASSTFRQGKQQEKLVNIVSTMSCIPIMQIFQWSAEKNEVLAWEIGITFVCGDAHATPRPTIMNLRSIGHPVHLTGLLRPAFIQKGIHANAVVSWLIESVAFFI